MTSQQAHRWTSHQIWKRKTNFYTLKRIWREVCLLSVAPDLYEVIFLTVLELLRPAQLDFGSCLFA